MKYAVIETGRSQEIVEEGKTVRIDELDLEKGKDYVWKNVLLVKDGEDVKIGAPYVKGAKVKGKVSGLVKGPKVINFKKKRRKGYKRKVGHRQKYTEILIEEIK
ncbi:MAG: 50S ribosomal protein L21 [Elusimicrobia bacterium]|jgi:large subunit ribosomal protein L21|nr:50S ribosomal protein L21 [Elusimicrobiota bacterium]